MKTTLLILVALFCQLVFAEDHSLTDITGKDIYLKSYDHSIAGSIKDFVIFGNNDEEKNLSELFIKKHGQLIKTTLSKTASGLGGTISHQKDGLTYETKIKFVSVDTREQKFVFDINDQKIEVLVKAEGFQNNHFINPQYIATLPNGETIDFKIQSGQACYRASIHLLMMILGTYLHQ